jgi:hypothetical protein
MKKALIIIAVAAIVELQRLLDERERQLAYINATVPSGRKAIRDWNAAHQPRPEEEG